LAFGRWTSARWTPPPSSQLFQIVERIWYFDGTMAFPKERVFPDGRAELIVMLDEPHRDGDDERSRRFRQFVSTGFAHDHRSWSHRRDAAVFSASALSRRARAAYCAHQ
jgi:hypothetical protein